MAIAGVANCTEGLLFQLPKELTPPNRGLSLEESTNVAVSVKFLVVGKVFVFESKAMFFGLELIALNPMLAGTIAATVEEVNTLLVLWGMGSEIFVFAVSAPRFLFMTTLVVVCPDCAIPNLLLIFIFLLGNTSLLVCTTDGIGL